MSIGGVGGGASMMRSFKPPTFESLDSNSSVKKLFNASMGRDKLTPRMGTGATVLPGF